MVLEFGGCETTANNTVALEFGRCKTTQIPWTVALEFGGRRETTANTVALVFGSCETTADTAVLEFGGCETTANTVVLEFGGCETTAKTVVLEFGGCETVANTLYIDKFMYSSISWKSFDSPEIVKLRSRQLDLSICRQNCFVHTVEVSKNSNPRDRLPKSANHDDTGLPKSSKLDDFGKWPQDTANKLALARLQTNSGFLASI